MPSGHYPLHSGARQQAVAWAWGSTIQQKGRGQGTAALIFFEVI
jgi:hypothetical protein